MDADFEMIRDVTVSPPLTQLDSHEFLIAENGNYLFISYHKTRRSGVEYEDSVIQEVTPDGVEVFRWNSWEEVKLDDCTRDGDTRRLRASELAAVGRRRSRCIVAGMQPGGEN